MESLEKQVKRLEKRFESYSKKEVPKATSSALNKVNNLLKTAVTKAVAADENLPSKQIRARITQKKSNPKTLLSLNGVGASDIPVISFINTKAILKSVRKGTNKTGVRAAKRQFDGAFINVLRRSGRFQVLMRKGKERYPVEVVKIPIKKSVQKNHLSLAKKLMDREFTRLYMSDLKYRVGKYGG